MALFDLPDDRAELARLGLIDDVGIVDADDGLVRRDLDDVEIVQMPENSSSSVRAVPVMPERLGIEAEEILEGDRGERLVFAGDFHAFFGLNSLVETFVIAAAIHQTAGEFIDDDDLPSLTT